MDIQPDRARKGRGAVGNPDGRFETEHRDAVFDGWEDAGNDDPPPLRTTLTAEASRRIITRNESPDIPFTQSINPYRGCEHGCVYCYARPAHAFMGLSAGLDFETRLFYKPDAPALLEAELRQPGYRCSPIAMGTNTDPYQPVERELGLTRRILEVLAACDHPVTITTKSALVLRDLDILAPMAARGLVQVSLSVTTLDKALARRLEPRAAAPHRRLAAIAALAGAGVPASVMAAPMIPGLNDSEMEAILEAASKAGAGGAGYILVRLPYEVKDLFAQWLETHAPDRAARVLSLIGQCRNGRLNDARFRSRMRGSGPVADLLATRFRVAARRLGLDRPSRSMRGQDLDTGAFRPPPPRDGQLRLL